jgi:hypothetical protein
VADIHANNKAAGVQSGPKSIPRSLQNMEKLSTSPGSRRADITVRRVKRNSMERIEKANARV